MELRTWNIPVIAMRGITIFPHMSLTFDVERAISIRALEHAMETDQQIFLVTQKSLSVNQPKEKDLYEVGVVSRVKQVLRISANCVRVMVEGDCRAQMRRLWQSNPYLQGNIEEIAEPETTDAFRRSPRTEALLRQTINLFAEYADLVKGLPDEVLATVMDCRDVG